VLSYEIIVFVVPLNDPLVNVVPVVSKLDSTPPPVYENVDVLVNVA
jgi:hypothetical protein